MISADSNIFIYLFDDKEPIKQPIAIEVVAALATVECAIGLQVVGEVRAVLQRKQRQPSWRASENAHNLFMTFDSFGYGRKAVQAALEYSATGGLSYWDALLVASAAEAGCKVLLSEDMGNGADYFGVRVINPFGTDGLTPAARAVLDQRG